MIGVLPIAKGGAKYAIVAVDYFTKWAEVKPLATITTKKVINIVTKNIICRFGVRKKSSLTKHNSKVQSSKTSTGAFESKKASP